MKYKAILFDLDGTLFDTKEGIIYSMLRSLDHINHPHPPQELHKKFIGPPINYIYKELCKVQDDEDIKRAFAFYKIDYTDVGVNLSKPYNDLKKTLQSLKQKGYILAVATLKDQDYAPNIIDMHGVLDCFDFIAGSDDKAGRNNKAKIIEYAAENLGIPVADCFMIGDSPFDALGAVMAGCDFGAVTFGFGFDDETHCRRYPAKAVFNSMTEIDEYF